jgi:phage-related minor tail protein
MFRGFNFFSSGSAALASAMPGDSMDNLMKVTGGFGTMPARAAGGTVTPGTSYLVGENGPELFTSGTSGSITPNNVMNGAMGGGPSVVYNGPYIASMSAIDTQSSLQFLAKNKQAVWAVYQSANRGVPVTR